MPVGRTFGGRAGRAAGRFTAPRTGQICANHHDNHHAFFEYTEAVGIPQPLNRIAGGPGEDVRVEPVAVLES